MESIMEIQDINSIVYIIKIIALSNFTLYTSLKVTNNKSNYRMLIVGTIIVLISIVCGLVKYLSGSLSCILLLIISLSIVLSNITKKDIIYCIIITTISLSINYIIFLFSIVINFLPAIIMNNNNEYINITLIVMLYIIGILSLFRIKKFRKGLIFLQKKLQNEYFNILILNISIIIIFLYLILENYQMVYTSNIGLSLIVFSILMFITIQKSLQLYYKQKLLIQNFEENNKEIENKNKEIKELEKENLDLAKRNHTISHKQKMLEQKVSELMEKCEMASELGINYEMDNLNKELSQKNIMMELDKTGIEEIDDMLKCMQVECIKNKIELNLQIKGNIHQMTNNYVSVDDLQILIADHVKNAIIAIKHSNNIYKNILIRLGKIDGDYGLYVYDTGIEFENETLKKLGKEPSTTHAKDGGSGMGFMNTFDTLNKYNASMTIKEIGKPSCDNYTKLIIVKFDNKNNVKIVSYK